MAAATNSSKVRPILEDDENEPQAAPNARAIQVADDAKRPRTGPAMADIGEASLPKPVRFAATQQNFSRTPHPGRTFPPTAARPRRPPAFRRLSSARARRRHRRARAAPRRAPPAAHTTQNEGPN